MVLFLPSNISTREAEERELREAALRRAEDAKRFEAEVLNNVKDPRSRAIAEQMKRKPFEAGNMEEMMHGGGHVHEEGPGHKEKATGVDLSDILGKSDELTDNKKEVS